MKRKTFRLKVDMENAAFQEDGMGGADELARILREVADKVEGRDSGTVLDMNGNRVGEWKVSK